MAPATANTLIDVLLTVGRTVALSITPELGVATVHNPLLLDEWRDGSCTAAAPDKSLHALLAAVMPAQRARELTHQLIAADISPAGVYMGVATLHAPRGGGAGRQVSITLHPAYDEGAPLLLMLRDITALTDLQQHLGETQLGLDAAMAALRAPPQGLREFLGAALTSISAIRSTLKLPARDAAAMQDKLARLHAAVAALGKEAEALSLSPVLDACQALLNRVDTLLALDEITGDALLPLAGLVDRIAHTAGTLWRIEEQRYIEEVVTPRSRRQPDWTHASERRWSSFLRHRGEELGVLVSLHMEGAAHVPRGLRSGVDELLQHMLRNAVEHGIETPEERLAAQKPATGTVNVKFELHESSLRMTVRDDGRGRGLGLTFLRRTVMRLGGQIAVAAKPETYTLFTIDLPQSTAQEDSAASQ